MSFTGTYTNEVLLSIWEQLKMGEEMVVSDATLSHLDDYFTEHEGPEADLYFRNCASRPNPNRVGLRDQYVAWLKL